MSAFVVNNGHINAMLNAAMRYGRRCGGSNFHWYPKGQKAKELTIENIDTVGQMLLAENIKSVEHRYEGSNLTDLPGAADASYLIPFKGKYISPKCPSPVEALKITECYMYQSCEHPEWENSEAHAFCTALKEIVISCLPGYDEAPWEWVEPVAVR